MDDLYHILESLDQNFNILNILFKFSQKNIIDYKIY